MLADEAAVGGDDLAGLGGVGTTGGDEIGIGAVADEADLLRLGFVGDGKAEGAGEDAGFTLVEATEGESEIAELVLGHGVEDVALVLGVIEGAEEAVRSVAPRCGVVDAGVVAGGETISPEGAGAGDEVAELHVAIALEAGIGGAAAGVLVDEGVDDLAAEVDLHVDGIEGDADGGAGATGVVHGGDTAAGVGAVVFVLGAEEAEIDAHDVVAAMAHEEGGDGAVDAAAHGDDAGLAVAVMRADAIGREEQGDGLVVQGWLDWRDVGVHGHPSSGSVDPRGVAAPGVDRSGTRLV